MNDSNPARILTELDRRLPVPTELTLYGRAALVLGFPAAEVAAEWRATMDVDAILPVEHLGQIESDAAFWAALDDVNAALESDGLYFTHLFEDRQVILRPDWLKRRVTIVQNGWAKLRLFRPSTADFILTKMMRVDPQDRQDIRFLMQQADFDRSDLNDAVKRASVPPIPEIESAFAENRAWLESLTV